MINGPPAHPPGEAAKQTSPSSHVDSRSEVEVVAPSRLHFGLLSFGHPQRRQFGGVGVMIERPAVCLRISAQQADPPASAGTASQAFCAVGVQDPLYESLIPRVARFAEAWAAAHGLLLPAPAPACRITIAAAPRQHVGLGLGTQLGLAVAAGLNALYGLPQPLPAELAISVGRGLRSAVGTYGFAQGGLIVERGKLPGETIAPLDCRLDLPTGWRVLLIQPPAESGLWGEAEQQAFDNLPPVPLEITRQLGELLRLRMLPAAARGDFEEFSESVSRYGRLAGMCFASVQGGPYNGPQLDRLVAQVQALGGRGVGQSSWGPTLFALFPDPTSAERFRERLAAQLGDDSTRLLVTSLNQTGARVRLVCGS